MFTEKEAVRIANVILKTQKKPKEEIIKGGLLNIAKVLNGRPSYYYSFGMYWWTIKKLMAKYLPSEKWYGNGVYDAIAVSKTTFDDDFLDYSVAVYYHNDFLFDAPAQHHFTDLQGNDTSYLLYDESAPTI